MGVRLLNRTTRSVTLTAAGEELLALISEPVDKIDQAIELLNKFRDEPTGRIRLNVFSDAALLFVGTRFIDICSSLSRYRSGSLNHQQYGGHC